VLSNSPGNSQEISEPSLNKPVMEKTEPRWVDHRNKAGIEKVFSNYLKTTKDSVVIYAESKNTVESLDPFLKEKIVDRLSVKKADQLVLFDLPPDICVLSKLINDSEAQIVHLTGNSFDEVNPVEIIRMMSGMLKYAYANRGGEVNVSELASKLSISDMAVKSCINLLDRVSIINVFTESDRIISYKFLGSKDLSQITGLEEYSFFVETINAVNEFRKQLLEYETSKIQKLLDTFKPSVNRL
jgi:hypothetical protein